SAWRVGGGGGGGGCCSSCRIRGPMGRPTCYWIERGLRRAIRSRGEAGRSGRKAHYGRRKGGEGPPEFSSLSPRRRGGRRRSSRERARRRSRSGCSRAAPPP